MERTDQPAKQPSHAVTCQSCNGSAGRVETTTDDGVMRQTWHSKGFGAAACPGGILGWAHSRSGTVGNGLGERTSQATTGTTSTQGLTTGQLVGLGATGAVIVVIAVLLVVLAYREAGRKDRRRIIGGAYVGSTLCLTAGVAGALAWLPGALNAVGDGVVAAVQGAGLL
ncbi:MULTISPECIES: hypothetical protein [Streptomyces]|uniref:Uncharacterized protein n=1 Tax=Streptomyces chartreusis NRRL 3882 TaxID=1079985 RepID=A0A2N9BB58_STRCX|nr:MULTISPECIES: hypothetical protein [Streptomyces]SOR80558.1 hypothetical protein SCNRRL3882_4013 [Streptomyces chartreusis NRRL 3882]